MQLREDKAFSGGWRLARGEGGGLADFGPTL